MNLLQVGILATELGTPFSTSDGMPCGTFSKLEIGTKVIVANANNGAKRNCIGKISVGR